MGEFTVSRHHTRGVTAIAAVSKRAFTRHTHEQYGIGIIDSGAQRSRSGRGMVEAGAGDIITVNPGEVHDGSPLTTEGRRWRMLYFDTQVIAAFWRDTCEEGGEYEFELPALTDRRGGKLVSRLLGAVSAPEDLLFEQYLVELLAQLGAKKPKVGRNLGRILTAKQMIDEDPASPWPLDALCRACGLSRFHFLRAFRTATGLTPHAYLLQKRIDLTRKLMTTGMPLSECAVGSGFADQSHMTRIFVAKYGLSPGAYVGALI